MSVGRFLCGIAALVYHPATQTYLLLRRAPDRDAGGGEWECVTGRVDQGEGFEEALHREVREELGAAVAPDFIVGTSHFYRGTSVPENELLGVTYACMLDDPGAIRVSAEHSEPFALVYPPGDALPFAAARVAIGRASEQQIGPRRGMIN